jgi:hypothetical protein
VRLGGLLSTSTSETLSHFPKFGWNVNDPNVPERPIERPDQKPSRSEEAKRIISEYANDLRELIKKLRKKLN